MHKEGIVVMLCCFELSESPHMNLFWTEPEVGKKKLKNPVISSGLNKRLACVHTSQQKGKMQRASEVVIIVDDFHLFHLFDPLESLCAH